MKYETNIGKQILITITAGVRGAIHEQSINKLEELSIPKTNIKNLMKNVR